MTRAAARIVFFSVFKHIIKLEKPVAAIPQIFLWYLDWIT